MTRSALIYDIEIYSAIPERNGSRVPNIKYCDGWDDHKNMGVSVIGVYDCQYEEARVFCQDNWSEFVKLAESREVLVGFNNIPFDNVVLRTVGIHLDDAKCYDLLREMWLAAGLGEKYAYPSHAGYGLDATCKANFGRGKTGNGALAPVLWQQGKIGTVIDYCLSDVARTRFLLELVNLDCSLIDPKTGKQLAMRLPLAKKVAA